jgi:hypothetical protein
MLKNTSITNTLGKTYQSLKKEDNFCRAEIKLSEFDLIYQIRLNHISGDEARFSIKQDSFLFDKLKAGKVVEMIYWTGGNTKATKFVKARVKNIIIQNKEILNSRYLVQLSIPKRRQIENSQRNMSNQRDMIDQLYMP